MKDILNKIGRCNVSCDSIRSIYQWDGLTWQELICKVFEGVNNCIETVNKYTGIIEEVLKWVASEGLEEEVRKGLDRIIEDGTLSEIINGEIFGNIQDKLRELEDLINENKEEINEVKTEIETLKTDI